MIRKIIKIDEEKCNGCGACAAACHEGAIDMVKALKDKEIYPRIRVEEGDSINFAVSCRHCTDPLCIKSCISGALSRDENGVVSIDHNKCVGCLTCILVCPYGAVVKDGDGAVNKCELCLKNTCGSPACVKGCPNRAIVYEER